MRIRDTNKEQAVIQATIEMVNTIGFASASINKIAKAAGVSVATIYIYHKNKEDLMMNVYYDVKEKIISAYFKGITNEQTTREQLHTLWNNIINVGKEVAHLLQYADQFSNSPFSDKISKKKVQVFLQPTVNLLKQGTESGTLKPLTLEEFIAFFTMPALFLSNQKLCGEFTSNKKNIRKTFELAWETVKN